MGRLILTCAGYGGMGGCYLGSGDSRRGNLPQYGDVRPHGSDRPPEVLLIPQHRSKPLTQVGRYHMVRSCKYSSTVCTISVMYGLYQ